MKHKDEYKEPLTIVFPEMVARVYSPILDSKERERRMQKIHKATAKILEGVKQ